MTKADLIANLGTVAKSGTTSFIEAMAKGQDIGMIGQFGVGFYSVYLVADKVRVVSKHNDDDQHIWESTAESSFTVAKDPKGNTLGRGTEITMFLKEDALDFLKQDRLQELVRHYSEFITFPISLYSKKEEVVEVEDDDDEKTSTEDGLEIEEDGEKPAKKTEKVVRWEWERLNGNTAIWARDKDSISDAEYQAFFKAINTRKGASGDARTWIHFKAEGEVEFRSILFVPGEAGRLYEEYQSTEPQIKLYVRKVLIQDQFDSLLPKYLNFIVGVVDSDDLPLNVSRETLQQHKLLKVLGRKLVRKVIEMLKKLAGKGVASKDDSEDGDEEDASEGEQPAPNDPEHPYIKFWEQFGKSIKMGCIEDRSNRAKLAKLLRFKSSSKGDAWLSLDDYVKDMHPWQTDIYYLAGESEEALQRSPFLDAANKKGVQVLLLTDPLDEYVFQHMGEFEGHKLQSLSKEGIKFGDEDESLARRRAKAYKDRFEPLTTYMKSMFSSKIGKVTVSDRVDKAPAVVVTSQWGYTANMERIMRAQTMGGQDMRGMSNARTLELNPRHPIVTKLNELCVSAPDEQNTRDLAALVFDTAMLVSGFAQEETDTFAERMYRVVANELKVKSLELEPEMELPPEEVASADEDDDEDDEDDDSGSDEL